MSDTCNEHTHMITRNMNSLFIYLLQSLLITLDQATHTCTYMSMVVTWIIVKHALLRFVELFTTKIIIFIYVLPATLSPSHRTTSPYC